MRTLVSALILTALAPGEIVDRIAANIGRQVITNSEVEEEVRVQAFLQGDPVELGTDNKRKALERLVEQFLVRHELEFAHFGPAADSDAEPMLKSIKARYPDEAQFQESLKKYGITAADLSRHINWTVTMLRFIEYRFQPAVQITPAQIQQEYTRQAAERKQKQATDMPPLEQVQADIEKVVRQRLVDAALDRWLGEARTQNDIVYHGEYKQ